MVNIVEELIIRFVKRGEMVEVCEASDDVDRLPRKFYICEESLLLIFWIT